MSKPAGDVVKAVIIQVSRSTLNWTVDGDKALETKMKAILTHHLQQLLCYSATTMTLQ